MDQLDQELFHLKARVLKDEEKVVFVEVDAKFVDVLLSFLAFPLGTIVRIFHKYYEIHEPPCFGSLNSLYRCLETLDSSYFSAETAKMMLLQPRNSFGDIFGQLKMKIDDTPPIQFYFCERGKCMTMYFNSNTCCCGLLMNKEVPVEDLYRQYRLINTHTKIEGGTFTMPNASFILGDDLRLLPNRPDYACQILREHKVNHTRMLEERSITWGFHQIMTLLEGSLLAKNPISSMIFRKPWEMREDVSRAIKFKKNSLGLRKSWGTNGVVVKVFIQKSTKRILFIQSQEDFVEIILGFLVLPLGTVNRLCGGDCGFGSLHNLYQSVSGMDHVDMSRHVEDGQVQRLRNSKLPYAYRSTALIDFQVKEDDPPNKLEPRSWWPNFLSRRHLNFVDPKGGDNYLKAPNSFVVMEDLKVSSTAASSVLSNLDMLDIPLCDVEEQVLEIGTEMVSCLLKAALTSTSALTDGLKKFLK